MKYSDWLDDWLINYVKPSSKLKTLIRYGEIINLHIKPRLGEFEMDDLTPLILQRFITDLLKSGNKNTLKGLSVNSVNSIISVLKSSLSAAFSLGLSREYIGNKIKRPKKTEKEVTCFTITEQKKIEQFVLQSKKIKLFGVLLCLYSGLRIGELLALEWTDVNFINCELTINKTCFDGNIEGKFTRITDTPKTFNSRRIIPLPKQLLPLLKEQRKKSNSKFVISNGDKIISVRSYQKTFASLLKKIGIEHKGFHSLRHTFATRALECGMDVKTLSEILGHKSPNITLTRYVHSLMEHKKNMMNKIGKLL